MSQILDRLGVWKEIEGEAFLLRTALIRGRLIGLDHSFQKSNRLEGSTDMELGSFDFDILRRHVDFLPIDTLLQLVCSVVAKSAQGSNLNYSTSVQEIHGFSPGPSFTAIRREGGPYEVNCDVVLECDGNESSVRSAMFEDLGISASVVGSDQVAYRILFTREQMEDDPELLDYVSLVTHLLSASSP